VIIVAGEALIDLAPRDGLLLPLPGGSPYNVAVGLSRLRRDTSYLGGLSTDAFGELLAARLLADGVDLEFAPRVPEPTTLAVVHLDEEARASYGFYIDHTAAAMLDEAALPATSALADDAIVHVSLGAIGVGHEPTGRALTTLLRTAGGTRLTSLDPNVRPNVFDQVSGRAEYARLVDELASELSLIKVSDEDLEQLHPEASGWRETATAWARSGPEVVVVTRGPEGAVAVRPDGSEVAVPGQVVEVADTVGAGDAFTAGLLAWLDRTGVTSRDALAALPDADLTEALTFARRVAAITCQRAGADPPHLAEVSD